MHFKTLPASTHPTVPKLLHTFRLQQCPTLITRIGISLLGLPLQNTKLLASPTEIIFSSFSRLGRLRSRCQLTGFRADGCLLVLCSHGRDREGVSSGVSFSCAAPAYHIRAPLCPHLTSLPWGPYCYWRNWVSSSLLGGAVEFLPYLKKKNFMRLT